MLDLTTTPLAIRLVVFTCLLGECGAWLGLEPRTPAAVFETVQVFCRGRCKYLMRLPKTATTALSSLVGGVDPVPNGLERFAKFLLFLGRDV